MRKSLLTAALLLGLGSLSVVPAQSGDTRTSASGNGNATATANRTMIQAGTQLAAELQSTLDARKARVGDQVLLKTTKAIKAEGQTVVKKGARLIGRVTEVEQKTKANATSQVSVLFESIESGSLAIPITATITSITSGRAAARANDDAMFEGSARSNTSASTQSGGGLVRGVTNTATGVVGGVVGGTTSAVGSTVNSTTGAVGNTAGGLTRSLGRIQISESTSASAEGGSTLSLRGDNLRLEKGTHFNLVVNQSASAGTGQP